MDNSKRVIGAGAASCYAGHFAVREHLKLVPAVTRAIVCLVNMPEKLAIANDLIICIMMIPPSSLDGRDSFYQTAQTLSRWPNMETDPHDR